MKISMSAEKFHDFIEDHKNEKGYVNLVISRRRTPSEHGDTHYATLDTWKPKTDSGKDSRTSYRQPYGQREIPPEESQPKQPNLGGIEEDDVPF